MFNCALVINQYGTLMMFYSFKILLLNLLFDIC